MGASHARLLAAEGARVVIGDVFDDTGEQLASEIGGSARYANLDVTDPDQGAGLGEVGRAGTGTAQHSSELYSSAAYPHRDGRESSEDFSTIPLGRDGDLHEVSTFVLFLASDESSYATGAEFVVDGGVIADVPHMVAP
jgi:NAD(P)-dependent dehydrogenase (short-subunit alcohol dehydrogenase family)